MKENTLADLLTDKEEFVNQQRNSLKYEVISDFSETIKTIIILFAIIGIVYTCFIFRMFNDNRDEISKLRQEIKQLQSK